MRGENNAEIARRPLFAVPRLGLYDPRMRISLPILSFSLLFAAPTLAQQAPAPGGGVALTGQPRAVGQYEGVVPGTSQTPSHIRQRPGVHPTAVTWPGFQPRADGASRFFVQTTAAVEFTTQVEGNRVVVVLRNTRVADRQSRRPLITTFFNTPVRRAYLETRRRDLALVLEMRANVQPVVSVEPGEGGYFFLYVSFDGGNYAPADAPPQSPQAPSPNAPTPATVPATPTPATEREAPPPARI